MPLLVASFTNVQKNKILFEIILADISTRGEQQLTSDLMVELDTTDNRVFHPLDSVVKSPLASSHPGNGNVVSGQEYHIKSPFENGSVKQSDSEKQ